MLDSDGNILRMSSQKLAKYMCYNLQYLPPTWAKMLKVSKRLKTLRKHWRRSALRLTILPCCFTGQRLSTDGYKKPVSRRRQNLKKISTRFWARKGAEMGRRHYRR